MGIFSLFSKSSTVYFPGCVTYFKFPENFDLYQKIFSKLGIDFKVLDKKLCCGLEALEAGYEQESRKLSRRVFEILREEGIDKIITTSPECYKMFVQNYPEFLPDWNLEVVNIWELIVKRLEYKYRLIKHKAMEIISFHDSCYLGRYSGIYNEPRKILEMIGYQILEMPDNKSNSICCGSCGGLPRVNLELADKIAKERLLQAKRLGVKKLVVCSLENYQLLKKSSEEVGIEVLELSEVLALALEIKKIEADEENIKGVEEEIIIEEGLKEEVNEEDLMDNDK